ncbi:DotI/IcmL/TraM family protein [Cysteiniphilum sp. JM-1]|uniref:DotI/IcmL/TraM family protein n=1 Tax=Cysteiniphilum sp. JM-1 TaxID=2610891 RepID=UPI0012447549|nr:DotI/IcmL/TraM family protein [Cysteiniphilum sp. JM-1]
MSNEVLNKILKRNVYFQQNFKKITTTLVISIVINVILIIAMVLLLNKPQNIRVIGLTEDARILQLPNSDSFSINDKMVLNWANRVIPSIYALDFMNYRTQFAALSLYFTHYGWQHFSEAFANTLNEISQKKFITHAVVSDVPVIVAKGMIDHIPTWKVEVPITVSYQKNDQSSTAHFLITVVIQKYKQPANNQIIGISQFIQQQLT